LSADAIRQHFALGGEQDAVADLSDGEIEEVVRAWLEAGCREPWETYDRWLRGLVAAALANRGGDGR
jgi:hypothetical protein